eukprot:scaffold43110_cov30-Tisochrysis_lutea.AAC.2
MAVAGRAQATGCSRCSSAHWSPASVSSSSRYRYSAISSKAVGSGCCASLRARRATAALRAASSTSTCDADTAAVSATVAGGAKKVAVPMTVVCPTVTWNFVPVLHAVLKKRMWRTAIRAQLTVEM